jgi:16S rRNA (guanine527-N7)-methyltransferase
VSAAAASRHSRARSHAAAGDPPADAARLAKGIHTLGVAMHAAQRDAIARYLELLAKWNDRYNLTAIREPSRMITHHALDALAVLPRLPQDPGLRVLDVGTGGGVPGILLAIARPDWQVTLLDASQKKGAFVTQAAIELGLANVIVAISRVEDFVAAQGYDIVISRAFASLADFADGALRHAAPQGRLYAMKGVMPDAEIAALPAEVGVVAAMPIDVPGLDARRSLVVMRRAH